VIDPRLVIWDLSKHQVRLARLDATDTATAQGDFEGIVAGQVIVLNGTTLRAMSRSGAVKTLGHLAATPESVVVNPDRTQWVYVALGSNLLYQFHVGSASGDRVVKTNPAITDQQVIRPYAWNAAGVYVTQEPLGIGGAGPFLEYHFPLGRIDLGSGQVTLLSPQCLAYGVEKDGTALCGDRTARTIQVRPPSGSPNTIHMGADTNLFIRVAVSPDGSQLIAVINGGKDPDLSYQMVVSNLTATNATRFGPGDYLDDAWLPDGRVVATHLCAGAAFGGAGSCSSSTDGTYIFSANGASHSLFFKLAVGVQIVGYV
jgi:hypothetical protein